jgi:hypothetical protein
MRSLFLVLLLPLGDNSGALPPFEDDVLAWRAMDAIASPAVEKNWLTDAAGSEPWSKEVLGKRVSGRKPGPLGHIIGCSRALEPEAEAAVEAARRSAISGLATLLLWRLDELERHGHPPPRLEHAAALARGVASSRLDSLIADRFDQMVPRPYGSLHRSALLVRAGDKDLKPLLADLGRALNKALREGEARRREAFLTAGQAFAVALGVFFLYGILNAATRGHFAGRLRVLSLLLLVLLYAGLLWWKGWIPG